VIALLDTNTAWPVIALLDTNTAWPVIALLDTNTAWPVIALPLSPAARISACSVRQSHENGDSFSSHLSDAPLLHYWYLPLPASFLTGPRSQKK